MIQGEKLRKAVIDERRQCCYDICWPCQEGVGVYRDAVRQMWYHDTEYQTKLYCVASQIYERVWRQTMTEQEGVPLAQLFTP